MRKRWWIVRTANEERTGFYGGSRVLKPAVIAIKKLGARRTGMRRDKMCFAKSWEASRRRQKVWSQCPGLSLSLSVSLSLPLFVSFSLFRFLSIPGDFSSPGNSPSRKLVRHDRFQRPRQRQHFVVLVRWLRRSRLNETNMVAEGSAEYTDREQR